MSMIEVSVAARRLGVSTRQVQYLVRAGDIRQVARGLVDSASVDRVAATRRGSRTRAWSEATAWGAVALLSGRDADWLGETQRSRLRQRLRSVEADTLLAKARDRATVRRLAGHQSAVARVRAELIDTHAAAVRLGLADSGAVDGYLDRAEVESVIQRNALAEGAELRFTLRATSMGLDIVRHLAQDSDVLAGLDLAESLDVRERSIGTAALDRALAAFRA